MSGNIESFILEAKKCGDLLRFSRHCIRIFAHYDTDGITSASILSKALTRENKQFKLTFLKQLNENYIKEIGAEKNAFVVFLDFGAGQIDRLNKHLTNNEKILIIDHHQTQGDMTKQMMHLNPLLFDITENISASGISYLVARGISSENKDLSELGIVGAIGDAQMGSVGKDWGLHGLNKEILKDSQSAEKIKVLKGLRLWGRYTRPLHMALQYSYEPHIPTVSGSDEKAKDFLRDIGISLTGENGKWRTLSELNDDEQKLLATEIIKERIKANLKNPDWIFGEIYELLDRNGIKDANEFATYLNGCGKLEQAHVGVGICLNNEECMKESKSILTKYRKQIREGMKLLKNGEKRIESKKNVHFVYADDLISEHVFANVVSVLHNSGDLEPLPLIGFVKTDDGQLKISARAPQFCVKKGVNLKEIMAKASQEVNGEGGGHAAAAGATIPLGSEDMFIKIVEDILSHYNYIQEPLPDLTKKEEETKPADTHEQESRTEEGNAEGSEDRAEEGRETSDTSSDSGAGDQNQEVEGQGLVRYFGA